MRIGKEDKNSLFVGNMMILDADYIKQAKKKKKAKKLIKAIINLSKENFIYK